MNKGGTERAALELLSEGKTVTLEEIKARYPLLYPRCVLLYADVIIREDARKNVAVRGIDTKHPSLVFDEGIPIPTRDPLLCHLLTSI